MKITKFAHCCLLIEEQNLHILTDPGTYSEAQNEAQNIDILLITHDHQDHYHASSVKAILAKNPSMKIITNTTVGKALAQEGIAFELLEHGQARTEKGVLIEAFGELHAPIIPGVLPDMQNTGYFIGNKMFYPGDAFTIPGKPVDVLALPVAAPWLKLSEMFEYAKTVKPRVAFPVHDAIMAKPGMFDFMYHKLLPQVGVEFVSLNPGQAIDI